MAYLDFDLEIEESNGGRDYRMVARSVTGDARAVMHFPYDELALESALDKLQIALLRSGGPARRALSKEEEAVQDFGRSLFAALFTEDVRGLYDASRMKAAQEGKDGVRLRLRVLAPELAALPWEYLYDPRQNSYLCLSRATPLVRYPEVAQPITPLRVTPPLRILAMIASPTDMDPLDVEREQERMNKALKEVEAQGLVQLEWLPGQTWRHLQRAMRGGPWHIFHFIGHGGFYQSEGVLALADDEGRTSLLSATQLGILLANHSALRLAVLNACEGARGDKRDLFSSTAATLARRGLPAVLAMQYDITDRAAIEYTRALYEALADQLPVDAALAEARAAIHLGVHNSLEWGTPVLYLRAPDGVLFDLQRQAPPRPQEASSEVDAPPASSTASARSAQPEQKESEQPKPHAKTKEERLKEGDTPFHFPNQAPLSLPQSNSRPLQQRAGQTNTLHPDLQPGAQMVVTIEKLGNLVGQGVGELLDGTRIIVENGEQYLNETVLVAVKSVRPTVAGGRTIYAEFVLVLKRGTELAVVIEEQAKQPGQGVGYLSDGTMIFVDDGQQQMNKMVRVTVTRVLKTLAGFVLFAQIKGNA